MPSTFWNTFLLFTTLLFLVQFQSTDARLDDPPKNCGGSGYPSPNSGVICRAFTSEELDHARQVGLKQHNYYRALHGAPPMTLNTELNARAQHSANCHVKWAAGLTHTGHDGENLYYYGNYSSKGPTIYNAAEAAKEGTNGWYGEYCLASTDPTDGSQGTKGHFTQLVWKSSTQMGLGIAQSTPDASTKMTNIYVVGRYLPHGNMVGETDKGVGALTIADEKMCCRNKGKLCDASGGSGVSVGSGSGDGGCDRGPANDGETPGGNEPGSGAETIKPGKIKMWQMVAITGVQSLVCAVLLIMMRT